MRLPRSRGPLSGAVLALLRTGSAGADAAAAFHATVAVTRDPLHDGDFQLALATCYELHYQGFDGVDDDLEWSPQLLTLRRSLEQRFEAALQVLAPPAKPDERPVHHQLRDLVAADEDPGLSAHLMRSATVEQMRDFLVQRSIYQLKEADPHTWAIPRVSGAAKTALVEIQNDEYGAGRPDRAHATLFARSMRALALDDGYGAYWDVALAETFAAVNAMSYFGLHRRLRGAAVGHLAAFEMTSTTPNGRVARGLRRLGFGDDATDYFDEHVEADAVHEQVAAVDLCGGLVADEPRLCTDVLWGAAVCLATVGLSNSALLDRWDLPDRRTGAA
jgi:hypothetical protein